MGESTPKHFFGRGVHSVSIMLENTLVLILFMSLLCPFINELEYTKPKLVQKAHKVSFKCSFTLQVPHFHLNTCEAEFEYEKQASERVSWPVHTPVLRVAEMRPAHSSPPALHRPAWDQEAGPHCSKVLQALGF